VLQFTGALCPIEQQSHLWVSEKGEEKEKEKKWKKRKKEGK
jgi:hypothetical protein